MPTGMGIRGDTPVYANDDRDVLTAALVDMGQWVDGEPLPDPSQVMSGVAGVSRVYAVHLPRGEAGLSLIAKFDPPERAAKEWAAIKVLRAIDAPLQALLPMGENRPEHQVMLYRNAVGFQSSGSLLSLHSLITQQLLHATENCCQAVNKALDHLRPFYTSEPGVVRRASNGRVLRWSDLFGAIDGSWSSIVELVGRVAPELKVDAERWEPAFAVGECVDLPNPLACIQRLYNADIGAVAMSRTHGDLNLTNVLVLTDRVRKPTESIIIDWANSQSAYPTATDFATLECDFWHEVFADLVTDADEQTVLRAVLATRNALDGRQPLITPVAPAAQEASAALITAVRSAAYGLLSGGEPYAGEDLFTCLLMQGISCLRFETVQTNDLKAKIALLGAALSCQTLAHIEQGRYNDGARARLSLPNDCPQLAPETGT